MTTYLWILGHSSRRQAFVSLTKRLKFKEIKGMRSSALKPSMVVRVRGLEENDSDESKMKNSKETSFKIRHDG